MALWASIYLEAYEEALVIYLLLKIVEDREIVLLNVGVIVMRKQKINMKLKISLIIELGNQNIA